MNPPTAVSPEDALKRSEERFALAMEATTEGIYEWNIESNQLEVSDRLNAILGLATGELTAEDWNERVHADDFAAYRDALIAHFKGESDKLACEYCIRRKGGDFIWAADTGTCVRDENARVVRLIGAIRNVNARKLAEQRLRMAREEAERA